MRKRFIDCLTEDGFSVVESGSPIQYRKFKTLTRGKVKIAIAQESLFLCGVNVMRFEAEDRQMTLHYLYVEPSGRNNGLGKEALESVCKAADELGFELFIEPACLDKKDELNRAGLVRMYEKFNFCWDDDKKLVMKRKATEDVSL